MIVKINDLKTLVVKIDEGIQDLKDTTLGNGDLEALLKEKERMNCENSDLTHKLDLLCDRSKNVQRTQEYEIEDLKLALGHLSTQLNYKESINGGHFHMDELEAFNEELRNKLSDLKREKWKIFTRKSSSSIKSLKENVNFRNQKEQEYW